MSRYGINYYNLAYYGPDNASQYVAGNFSAFSYGYGKIRLNWDSPAGTWAKIKLVRNSYGFPVNPWDGDELVSAFIETDPTTYLDELDLVKGAYYYYSLFVLEIVTYTWVRVGDATGVSTKDFGYTNKLYSGLPDVHKITNVYDASGNYDNNDLYKFLSLFGFELDRTYTEISLLNNRYDIQKVRGDLIPLYLQQFGYSYEKEIGYQQSRILARDAIQISKEKGSSQGLREFIKAFTGYAVPKPSGTEAVPPVDGLTRGHNLMLDHNDSSFEESVGHWASSNSTAVLNTVRKYYVKKMSIVSDVATLVLSKNHTYKVGNKFTLSGSPFNLFNTSTAKTITAVTSNSISYSLTGPEMPLQNAYNKVSRAYPLITPSPLPWEEATASTFTPNKQSGVLSVINSSGSTATIKFECGLAEPITRGIPVTAALNYTFSGYTITGGTARSITMGIRWYNRFGVFISESSGTASNNATGEFVSGSRKSVTDAAPAESYYAVPTIQIASAAGSGSAEYHYFDALQFEQANAATSFDEARQIHLTLRASRINELKNPAFIQTGSSPITINPWTFTNSTISFATTSQQPSAEVYTVIRKKILDSTATLTLNVTHEFRTNQKIVVSGMGAPLDGVWTIIEDPTPETAGIKKRVSFTISGANVSEVDASGIMFEAGTAITLTATGSSVVLKSWDGSTSGQLMPINYPDSSYTFSVYAQAMNVVDTITPSITWYNSSYGVISTTSGRAAKLISTITDVSGDGNFVTYQSQNNFVVGQTVTISGITMIDGPTYNLADVEIISANENQFIIRAGANGRYQTGGIATPTVGVADWIRPYVTSTAPANAAYASVQVTWDTVSSRTINYDSALFENSAGVGSYFDGAGGTASPADIYWEGGSTNAGRSHLYKNRFAAISRLLTDRLPEQLMPNTPVTLYLAQPST
jgi:hypothetical protein